MPSTFSSLPRGTPHPPSPPITFEGAFQVPYRLEIRYIGFVTIMGNGETEEDVCVC